jgi:hypothetical protein
MKKTVKERHASGLALPTVLLLGVVTACAAPTEPAEPAISAKLAGEAKATVVAFSFSRTISIDFTQVPNTDQKNFPVLVSGTYAGPDPALDLRTTGNGGKVRSPSGYDVGFYTSANCSSGKMKWETEEYNAVTGEVAYWVLVPTVSHTKSTVFYICYGNSSITTNQSSPAAVWDSHYLTVWHLADKGGLDLSNSADTKFAFTNSGPVASAPGKIGGGTNKFADATYYLDNAAVSIGKNVAVTISMWKKLLAADGFCTYVYPPPPESPYCAEPQDHNDITFGFGAGHDAPNSMTLWAPFFNIAYWYYAQDGPSVDYSSYFDRWVYITVVYNPGASRLKALYLDGRLAVSSTNGPTTTGAVTGFRIGQAHDAHGQDPSQFDEVRISNSARSPDWITTEFNNQSNPALFYALGAETLPH